VRDGRPAVRALVAVALVALPLTALALSVTGSPPLPAAPRDAILRLAPGPDEPQAVRSAAGSDVGARGTAGARAGLLAVLLGATAVIALRGGTPLLLPAPRVLRTGRGVPAAGRGPPLPDD
jgi:hypothetical protein